jgi:uroporphyrinogen-III synthase
MRILVTRPEGDAEETAARLRALGHDPLVASLLDIRLREGPDLPLDDVQAVLATSANGVRALAKRTKRRDIPLFTVGAQSASAARLAGFEHIQHADGDAAALAALAAARLAPSRGALLHAAGIETRGGLAEKLAGSGFAVRSEILYDAVACKALPGPARDALDGGTIDAALFFSPRSARIFVELVEAAGLSERCGRLAAICISRAAAEALAPLRFDRVGIAARPNQEALLALLETPSGQASRP